MQSTRSQLLMGLGAGLVFGFLLQKGGATHYDVIVGQLLLTDFTIVKIMLSAIVTGGIGIHLMRRWGWVQFTPRTGSWGKNAVGGLIFGVGFALLGYCPGTVAGAIGNGFLDAATAGLIGVILGAGLFAVAYPRVDRTYLVKAPFRDTTLPEALKVNEWAVLLPLGALVMLLFYLLERAGL